MDAAVQPTPGRGVAWRPLAIAGGVLVGCLLLSEARTKRSLRPSDSVRAASSSLDSAVVDTGGWAPLAAESALSYSYSYSPEMEEAFAAVNYLVDAAITAKVACPVKSALCNIAACTLNADQRTASCGCQKMPASTGNPAVVDLNEAAVLAGSSVYAPRPARHDWASFDGYTAVVVKAPTPGVTHCHLYTTPDTGTCSSRARTTARPPAATRSRRSTRPTTATSPVPSAPRSTRATSGPTSRRRATSASSRPTRSTRARAART